MSAAADELHPVSPGILVWHAYDSVVKTELFSTAATIGSQTLLIDPIPLDRPALGELLRLTDLRGIAVTNGNHVRASAAFASQFSLPIFAQTQAYPDEKPAAFTPLAAGSRILESIEVTPVAGAAEGEIALFIPGEGGSLVIGDALINADSYGFTFLPPKYCLDHKQMKKSLRQLLDFQFERILFAHGTPILSKARARLEQLLDV